MLAGRQFAPRRFRGIFGYSLERQWCTSVGALSRVSGFWSLDWFRRDWPAGAAGRVADRRGLWRSLVSASVWGTEGREFKSPQPDKQIPGLNRCLAAAGLETGISTGSRGWWGGQTR